MRINSLTTVTGASVLATLSGIIAPSLAHAATGRAVGHADYAGHLKPTFKPRNIPANITVTTTADSGAGSLRQALSKAAPGDVIGFASTVTGAIHLTASLYIDESVYLRGPGAGTLDIDAGGHGNVFVGYGGYNSRTTITGLTISGGNTSGGNGYYHDGGGIDIQNGALTLYNDVITGNHASSNGGGVYLSSGTSGLDVYNTTISNNTAAGTGGGVFADLAGDEMTIERSTISGNSGTEGGGVYVDSCPVHGRPVNAGTDPAVCEVPRVYQQTGGEYFCEDGSTPDPTTHICTYAVQYDSGTSDAYCYYGSLSGSTGSYTCTGGPHYRHTYTYTCPTGSTPDPHNSYECYETPTGSSSYATIDNSTISTNTASQAAGAGGGVFLRSMAGQAEILRSTIVNNSGGGVDDDSPAGSPVLVADLISQTGTDCTQPGTSPKLADGGYNVISDASCGVTASTSHASAAIASSLGALANNGGLTQTIALARTSSDPAYKSIPASAQLPGGAGAICSGTDQRGVVRTGSCDVGAFDTEAPPLIVAKLSSQTAKSKAGWYRSNVTVSFPCASSAPGIVAVACPPAKVDSKQGKNVAVSGTAVAQDGQTATATAYVNLDKTKPSVKGVKSGSTYKTAPKIKCSDSLSGVASCKVTKTKPSSKHVVKYTVKATDKAGNVKTVKGSYKLKK